MLLVLDYVVRLVYTCTCKCLLITYISWVDGGGLQFQSAMFTSIYTELQQQERSRCREIGLLSVTNILLGD